MRTAALLTLVSSALLLGLGAGGCVIAAGPMTGTSPAATTTPAMQTGIDRPGDDYKDFDLPAPNPALCQQDCAKEAQCVAWVYVKPGFQGDSPRCWLKNKVPAQNKNACCISGVK